MSQSKFNRRRFLSSGAAAIGLLAGAPAIIGRAVAQGAAYTPRNVSLPARGEVLIRSGHLITMDPRLGEIVGGAIHIRDGRIIAVGPDIQAPGARVVDARDQIVMPGFVDTHVHLWNGFMKGMFRSDDPKNGYFPLTQRAGPLLSPEDAYRSVRLGAADELACGITTLNNWAHNIRTPEHANAEVAALQDMGIRARHSYGWGTDFKGDRAIDIQDVGRLKAELPKRAPLVTAGVAIRTSVAMERGSVDMGVLRREIEGARKLSLPLTMHARPRAVATLEEMKLLGPDLQLVHPLGFTAEERQAIVRSGAKICTSPVSELSAQQALNGHIQYAELSQIGAQIALSVDTLGSSGNADFFQVMRGLLYAHRQRNDTKVPLTPKHVLELATIEGAKQLALDDRTGSLAPGKRADLITIRTTDVNMAPVMDDPIRAVVLSAAVSNIDMVMVDGRVLREGGKFTFVDPLVLAREAAEAAASLKSRLG